MEEQTIMNFTKKMLAEKIFSCVICKNLLSLPVMMVENIGNVCHDCFESRNEENEWKGSPNTELNVMLKELKFPCKFDSEGCEVKMIHEELKDHQNKCIFRKIKCIMPNVDCEWKGKLLDLANHFQEEHPKEVINSPNDTFSFQINPTKFQNILKLLKNKNKIYVLKIEEHTDNATLLHFIRDIKSITGDVEMVIKYVGKNGQYKAKSKRLSFNDVCDENTGTKICLLALKNISEINGTATFTIKPAKREMDNINGQVLKQLECPICKDVMRPPIHQCITGHSLCNSCRPKLDVCPACRQTWGNIRNFSLEGLTPSIQYSCVYNQFGCDAIYLGNEINEHEGVCEFKMYSCPESNCNFTGNYLTAKSHFNLNHKDLLIESTIYQATFVELSKNAKPTENVKYIFEHNNLYKLTFKRLNDSCTWMFRILNDYDKKNKYFYAISITDPKTEQRKITKSNLCLNKNDELTDRNIVHFTYNELISYKNSNNANDQIMYRCHLYKHDII